MKKEVFILISIIFLLFPLVSAAEIIMNDVYSSGETLVAKVSGNFIEPLTKSNVFFYQGPVLDSNFQVSFDYDVIKLGTDFYIYAILLDKTEGEYSLSLENIKYMKGSQISEEDIVKNFSIDSQTADFSVKPGMVVAQKDFSVEVQNLNENPITVEINTATNISGAREIFVDKSRTSSLNLLSGQKKKINFQLGEGKLGMRTIQLKTDKTIYEMPIYIPESFGQSTAESIFFSLEPSELNLSIPLNKTEKKVIYLYNLGEENLTDFTISLSESLTNFVNLSTKSVDKLDAHSSVPIELFFSSTTPAKANGELLAQTKNLIVSSSIFLQFSKNATQLNATCSTTRTCEELNGTTYDSKTYECDQTPCRAKDQICCLGNLKKLKKAGSSGTTIAIILTAVVILALVWFYFAKYRKTKKPINLLKMARPKKF